ncbi:MAG: hypothetical protein ABW250_01880, partial [Pyrinomonadaceae bacterium]
VRRSRFDTRRAPRSTFRCGDAGAGLIHFFELGRLLSPGRCRDSSARGRAAQAARRRKIIAVSNILW